jgi:integrase
MPIPARPVRRLLGSIDLVHGQAECPQGGRKAKPRGRSRKSVWNVHICIRAALNDAIENGLLKVNPAKGALKEPTSHQEMKTWTVEELRAYMGLVKGERNFALYRLAAYSGMRRGELVGLRWVDVKFHLGSVSVQQQLGIDEDGEDDEGWEEDAAPVFVPLKTRAGRRSIKLDALTLGVLREHRATQEFERRAWGDGYHHHDLVFCRPDGMPHDPDTISGQFERLVRRSRLKRIRFHDPRHTHATLLLEAHVDVTVVSRRLGHANVQITADRYAHVTARLQYDAAERSSALVQGDPDSMDSSGRCDAVVTPWPPDGISEGPNGVDSYSESGSGVRIRTVNLAVNSRLLYR